MERASSFARTMGEEWIAARRGRSRVCGGPALLQAWGGYGWTLREDARGPSVGVARPSGARAGGAASPSPPSSAAEGSAPADAIAGAPRRARL